MKSKITLLVLLIILPVMSFMGNEAFAQTVSGIASNTGCFNSGIVTASSTGLGATPQYQLSKAGVVVAPVSGDPTQFTNTNVFTGLSSGVYVVNARATAGGTVFSSTNITVTDGYTAMTVSTPTKVADCVGGTASLTSTVTAGKAPYTYTIAAQSAPGVILQNSGPISATTFNFNPLGVNNYLVSVTDDCGQTITGATSISNPTVTVNDFKLGSLAYPSFNTTNNCSTPLNVINELLFQYIANSTTISPSDAARFSWKILYQGQLYGQDTNADGYSDVGGAGYSPLLNTVRLPLVATKAGVLAEIASGTMKVVLSDNCGNSKEFNVTQYNSGGTMGPSNCAGAGLIRAVPNRLSCFPLNVTFTNIANPADIVTTTINSTAQLIAGFTAGATYHVTYVDAQGSTTRSFDTLPVSQNISIPAASTFTISQVLTGVQQNLNVLGYGRLILTVTPVQAGDIINYTVTASDNPLVPVGYTSSTPLNATSGSATLPRVNASDPLDYWPSGHYTLDMTIPCGTRTINATVSGYNATLNGNTITPVCGGFNYVMNGNFDSVSAYQVIIVSGPSSVGQVRDLASNTASLPFNGLSYGTYVFGLRIKGGTVNVLTQTLTYDSNNVITVDKTNTGGYVCSSGATNGTLTIAATSNSPAPGNVLEYALSTDGGTNFGAYQSGNTFSGLTDNTYFFRIKDGCGNIITQSAQIGVAAAPTATAEGQSTPATFCNLSTGTLQLDVDTVGAISYLWTGPGITTANETLKSPLVNYNALSVGNNNFSCSVTFGPPCSSTTVSNLTINITALPVVSITNPAAVCFPNTVDITAPAITAGSETGLTYSYFTDSEGTDPIVDPTIIDVSGTYYIKGTNATCSNIQPVTVIVNSLPIAGITYPSTPYCQTGTATVTQTGTTGGTYSGDAGLIIDAVTGTIDLAGSTIGDHTVTYSFTDGTCSSTDIALIEINELPTASIAYSSSPYCNRGTATVTQTGEAGGTYSGDTGLIIDPSTGTIDLALSTVGTHTITYNFSNATCSGTTTASITINATVAPSVLADITGQCEATPIAPTITDPCAGTITGATTTLFPITTQGTTVVTWTFDYGNGYTQTANQNVIIDDTLGPVMPILADVTGECSATPTVPIATDTCTGAITGATTTAFPITAKGTTIVLWTFDDGNGNISFANQNVIITDTTAPVVPVLADVTAECSATPLTPTTTDNCDSGVITGTTSTIFPITTQGTTVVTWNFTDSSGNTSTATQNIIIDDTIAPVAPVLADVTGQCDATPSAPTATDACAGTITGTTTTAFPITTQGTTVVTWTFDDGNGNTSTANQNVIIDDTVAPVVPVLADLTGQCDATPIAPAAADACAGTITGTTTTVFPITAQGTSVVTWTFDDGNGNIATANQNVIIDDTIAPVAPVLADVTGQCNATPAEPTAADACAGIITGTTTTVFPITTQGTTVVTWTFDDGNGNIATANQNVIIDDTVAPVAPVLADVTGQCNATPAVPTAVDACAGTITGTTTTAFPITVQGTTVVTWTFDDGNGNIATAAQNVIIDDTIAPVAPVLADVTGQCNATPAVPTAVDACAGTITGTTTTAFPITAQGTTVVTWTFDDGNGNIATAAQNVIIDDT
ncbi:hypothetical protein IRZ83_18050, partial [Flavobacterium sp. JLP]|uniref:beta strand repeat-containing protein n=1 Tax=Flavobacterium sp. JLP TaxID=2783793 RepID=UPI0019DC45CB